MAHLHNVYDDDQTYVINPSTRAITNKAGSRTIIMQTDHNSEILKFEIPKLVEGHDMTKCDLVEVHYDNIGTGTSVSNREVNSDVYPINALYESDDDPNILVFIWPISDNATKLYGTLDFSLKFICYDTNEAPGYVWNTDICKNIDVKQSKNNRAVAYERDSDLYHQLESRVSSLEEGNLDIDVDQTLSVDGMAADAAVTGKRIGYLETIVDNNSRVDPSHLPDNNFDNVFTRYPIISNDSISDNLFDNVFDEIGDIDTATGENRDSERWERTSKFYSLAGNSTGTIYLGVSKKQEYPVMLMLYDDIFVYLDHMYLVAGEEYTTLECPNAKYFRVVCREDCDAEIRVSSAEITGYGDISGLCELTGDSDNIIYASVDRACDNAIVIYLYGEDKTGIGVMPIAPGHMSTSRGSPYAKYFRIGKPVTFDGEIYVSRIGPEAYAIGSTIALEENEEEIVIAVADRNGVQTAKIDKVHTITEVANLYDIVTVTVPAYSWEVYDENVWRAVVSLPSSVAAASDIDVSLVNDLYMITEAARCQVVCEENNTGDYSSVYFVAYKSMPTIDLEYSIRGWYDKTLTYSFDSDTLTLTIMEE